MHFMKIHKDDVETCVGAVYRSPNSNHSEFVEIYKTITTQLKSNKNIHILGDFNTNLFRHNDPNTKKIEDHFLASYRSIEGLYFTVFLHSHKRVTYSRYASTTYSFLVFKMSSVQELFLAWQTQFTHFHISKPESDKNKSEK